MYHQKYISFYPKTAHMKKKNEEFLRIKSLKYNAHIFHYVNDKLSLRKKILNFNQLWRLTCLGLASNKGNGHDIQYGNGQVWT